ncbi:MAG: hypothetical protein HeimC2_09570 [Candidatus Heimdallarchaeota archaeon LC_2]|nr:MAG: hypothetical protein HeimC2_09570 [Candidatus Heimdallarchaeota archaeon LC_2]
MSELHSDFDLQQSINKVVKDEITPILKELNHKNTWTRRRENITEILEYSYSQKEPKLVSGS